MAEKLRHPRWCHRASCVAVLELGTFGGEHLSKIRLIQPDGDESIRMRVWLVGVPETDEGLPTQRSTFIALELMEEDQEHLFLLEVHQALALRWEMGLLLTDVTA